MMLNCWLFFTPEDSQLPCHRRGAKRCRVILILKQVTVRRSLFAVEHDFGVWSTGK
jgi:hypothetical protein